MTKLYVIESRYVKGDILGIDFFKGGMQLPYILYIVITFWAKIFLPTNHSDYNFVFLCKCVFKLYGPINYLKLFQGCREIMTTEHICNLARL